MRDFHIGDRVTFFGRAYFVRGVSPMSVAPPTIHLEDEQTGELVEVAVDDLTGRAPGVRPNDGTN
jgi:hypothetical protein